MQDCCLKVSELEFYPRDYFHFWTNILGNIIPPTIGKIVSLLFFNKDGFVIKLPMKVDMPLNKKKQKTNKQSQSNQKRNKQQK